MTNTAQTTDLDFDPDALRERYRIEREKRLRADGNDQYIEVSGDFARFVDDPYLGEKIEREPVTDEVDVLTIVGGFGVLQAGANLCKVGVHDIRMFEKRAPFGGT